MKVIYDGELRSIDLLEIVCGKNDIIFSKQDKQLLRCAIIKDTLVVIAVNDEDVVLDVQQPVQCYYRHYKGYHIDFSFNARLDGEIVLTKEGYKRLVSV